MIHDTQLTHDTQLVCCMIRPTQPPSVMGREMCYSLWAMGAEALLSDWGGGMSAYWIADPVIY